MLNQWKEKTFKIIKITTITILYIILIPILLLNLIFITKSVVNPNEIPSLFGFKVFVVVTGSMENTINSGDLILSKKIDTKKLKEQDIVSFKEGNIVITHRIQKIDSEDNKLYFWTKGDNNNELDKDRVEENNIEGIYFMKIANLGNFILFMQSKIGMFLFLVVPICFFTAYYIIESKINNNKKDNEILELQKKINESTKDKK